MLVIGVGCGLDVPAEEEENAQKLAKEAPRLLMGDDPRITPTPNAIEEWTDIPKVCAPGYMLTVPVLDANVALEDLWQQSC